MSKKHVLFFVVIFLSSFSLAQAQITINEVQLSPTEERFLELYNTSNEPVDLTGWYIQRKTLEGTTFGSLVSKPNFEGKIIGANDYFVISRTSFSNSDVVLGTLTLTESNTIQIKNTAGEVVDLICWGENCSTVSNPTEGKSIQKNGNSWVVAGPTRGNANQSSSESNNDDEDDTSGGNEEENNSQSQKQIPQKLQKTKVQIISTKLAHVGIPFALEGNGTGTLGEKLTRGVFYWNFDDGDFREVRAVIADKFTHTYFYPGDYTITFEYYPDVFTDVPDAITEITIKVLEPKILISRVGEANDFFIEIANETGHEANLSNWVLLSDYKIFTLPKNTTLSSNKKMIISPRISGFSIEDKSSLRLMTPQRELVYRYISPVTSNKVATKKQSSFVVEEKTEKVEDVENDSFSENLSANSISGIGEDESSNTSSVTPIIFVVFVGVSASGVYFIRRYRNTSKTPADDFDILDE